MVGLSGVLPLLVVPKTIAKDGKDRMLLNIMLGNLLKISFKFPRLNLWRLSCSDLLYWTFYNVFIRHIIWFHQNVNSKQPVFRLRPILGQAEDCVHRPDCIKFFNDQLNTFHISHIKWYKKVPRFLCKLKMKLLHSTNNIYVLTFLLRDVFYWPNQTCP